MHSIKRNTLISIARLKLAEFLSKAKQHREAKRFNGRKICKVTISLVLVRKFDKL